MIIELTCENIRNLMSWSNFRPATLEYPNPMSDRQREWEYYVTKLHGADLVASKEDLETLKNLVSKLGR